MELVRVVRVPAFWGVHEAVRWWVCFLVYSGG